MHSYLTFDIGTTSVKVCLFDEKLKLTVQTVREYDLLTYGDRVEADPQIYRNAIAACISELGDCSDVVAIAITTQGETLIPVDAEGMPLCNAMVWLDGRAHAEAEQLSRRFGVQSFYEETGLPEISGALPLAKMLWIRNNLREVWTCAAKFILLEDYIIHWLTGRFVTEKSLQCSTGWFSLKTDGYWSEALEAVGLDAERLPEPVECGTIVGKILPDRAAEWRMPDNVVVVTGAMDQTAAALAAESCMPGCICETTGTAMVAAAKVGEPVFSDEHRVTIYRGAAHGSFIYLPISNTAGMALKWLKTTFFSELADVSDAYDRLSELAATSEPGASGVLFLPYLAGAVDPEGIPDATACFWGIRISSSLADFVRAVMESVAYQLRDFLAMLEKLGFTTKHICSLGGGSLSPFWLQIKADVCGCTIHTLQVAQATSLGAAILAARALTGEFHASALPKDEYVPQQENHAIYERRYAQYKRLFRTVRPLYEEDGKDD